MNSQLLLTLFISCALATRPTCNCDDPCDDCEEPRVYTKTFSPVIEQEVKNHVILVCSRESYFQRIEYEGSFDWNTTCNGVVGQEYLDADDIYTGVKVDDRTGKESYEVLNASYYKYLLSNNNGNSLTYEYANLDNCVCSGDTLRSYSNWAVFPSDARLTGCCNEGVKNQEATSYQLKIYGKCCSECHLKLATQSWEQAIKN